MQCVLSIVANTRQHLRMHVFWQKQNPIVFKCAFCNPHTTSLPLENLVAGELELIASRVHQVWASDAFSRAAWLRRLSAVSRPSWNAGEALLSQPLVWTLGCLSFSNADDRLLKPQNLTLSGCYFHHLQVILRKRFRAFFVFCLSVLPEAMKGRSDWLNSVHFGCKFFESFSPPPRLEKLKEGRLVALWKPGLISVGRSGMNCGGGGVMVFRGQ